MFRKIFRDNSAALLFLLSKVHDFVDRSNANPGLEEGRKLLAQALGDVRAMVDTLTGYFNDSREDPRQLYRIGLVSVAFMLSLGDLLIGWLLLTQAAIACTAINNGIITVDDGSFYRGKIAAAIFFARTVLPRLSAGYSIRRFFRVSRCLRTTSNSTLLSHSGLCAVTKWSLLPNSTLPHETRLPASIEAGKLTRLASFSSTRSTYPRPSAQVCW